MNVPNFLKILTKKILSSESYQYKFIRELISALLQLILIIIRPLNSKLSTILQIYRCIFCFHPDRLASELSDHEGKFDRHRVIASRAFFEIAFARGELLKICSFLKNTTFQRPNLFVPWKLLHYAYYFTRSWTLLTKINSEYELYRYSKLKLLNIFNNDLIIGDHVTSSIGHSQIFFEFHIIFSDSKKLLPRITILESSRDKMSEFYKKIIPHIFTDYISLDSQKDEQADLINFVQDSFPFIFCKNYFHYADEKEHTKFLSDWIMSGGEPFLLDFDQNKELNIFLQDVGLGANNWFVVLHVREGLDGSIRNADIKTYINAINSIVANGGWVFRIGDVSMTPLDKSMSSRVVDLPFSKIHKPKYLDLYLLASARFVICTCSGPSDFPLYFNVPRVVTNWPIMSALHGTSNDVCIPISYRCAYSNRIVTLREQIKSNIFETEPKLRSSDEFISIQNTPEQIKQATIDMINFTSQNIERNRFPLPKQNSLYFKFINQFWFMGEISKSFLKDNPNYLD